jgi:monoamine oxidase
VSRWYSTPYVQGSYSYQTVQSELAGVGPLTLADPVGQGRVLFAGEATHPSYFSTVHGAIESGWREADRIICGLTQKN